MPTLVIEMRCTCAASARDLMPDILRGRVPAQALLRQGHEGDGHVVEFSQHDWQPGRALLTPGTVPTARSLDG